MLASVPIDLQVHDTFFVVAHFHYVLIGGAVFPLFGAFYYWFPKFTGRMLNERLGKWQLLALLHRLQPHVLPDAHLGLDGHAPPRLHLSRRTGLGHAEPAGEHRRAADRASFIVFLVQCGHEPAATALQPAPIRGMPARSNGRRARRLRATTSSMFRSSPGTNPLWIEPDERRVVTGLRPTSARCLITHHRRRQTRPPRSLARHRRSGLFWPRSRRPSSSSARSSRLGRSIGAVRSFITLTVVLAESE